jgi:glycosyltransferase involved in cell wall biosynthesis
MARSLRMPLTGVGRYTLNLARGLTTRLSPAAVTLFLTRDAGEHNLPARRVRATVATPHEMLRAVWEQAVVPLYLDGDIDLYHSPNYTLPAVMPCPSVVTIHDLAYLDASVHKLTTHLYLSALTSVSLRRADRIITVSEATRDALVARFPRVAARVETIYQGLDPLFEHPPEPPAVRAFRERQGLHRPYVLFVGSIEPRKNLPRLIHAFERTMQATGLPHELLLCGPLGWRYGETMRTWRGSALHDRIRHLGYVSEDDLPLWYAGADLFVYPSLYEGFGFPPLEAMACRTPVITSDCSSLPEVVGDAALTVPPTDVAAMASAMERALTDFDLARGLRERGVERARGFRWDDTIAQTLAVYKKVLRA